MQEKTPTIPVDPMLATEQSEAQNDLTGALETQTQGDMASLMARYGTQLAMIAPASAPAISSTAASARQSRRTPPGVLDCISRLVAAKKIDQQQADFARKIYRGIVDDDALNTYAAQREGFAALKTAEAMAKDAANKKIELAQSTEIYNSLSERMKAHPDSQKAGFAGMWDRDIRAAAGPNRENVTSLRDANYMPQLAAKMHAATDAYEFKAGGLTQDTAGIRQMVGEVFGVKTGNKIAETAAKGWSDMVEFGTKTAKDLGKIFYTDKDWRLSSSGRARASRRPAPSRSSPT